MRSLFHYSAHEFTGPVKSRTPELSVDMKPRGLWVSAKGDDDWLAWCEAENFGLDRLAHASEIILRSDHKVLGLASVADIDAFHAAFVEPLYPGERSGRGIDWRRVAERYDGIVISPYQWSRRLDGGANWYYGWDCASGCIWDARAVADVRPHETIVSHSCPKDLGEGR